MFAQKDTHTKRFAGLTYRLRRRLTNRSAHYANASGVAKAKVRATYYKLYTDFRTAKC